MIQIKELIYATVDDRDLTLDLYLPEGNARNRQMIQSNGGHPPLVLWIHGGGWREGSKAKPPLRRLVDEGFALASISHRFTQTSIFPAQIHDCKSAVRWLRASAERYGYSAARIAATGCSSGGHLAALLGTNARLPALEGSVGEEVKESTRVQCVVDYFGPADFPLRARTQAEIYYTTQVGSYALLGGVQNGVVSEELEVLASPVNHVTSESAPLLMFHGTADRLVLPDQSQSLLAAYQRAGASAELHLIEGAEHGGFPFFTGASYERTKEFLTQHLID